MLWQRGGVAMRHPTWRKWRARAQANGVPGCLDGFKLVVYWHARRSVVATSMRKHAEARWNRVSKWMERGRNERLGAGGRSAEWQQESAGGGSLYR